MNVKLHDTDEILEKSKRHYLEQMQRQRESLLLQTWERWKPKFSMYLNGSTVAEVCAKYNLNRTDFYSALRKYHVPVITEAVNKAANTLIYNRHTRTRLLGELDNCSCFVCNWIKARLILKK